MTTNKNDKLKTEHYYELNKIYCEDCYEAIKKIPSKSIDLIITDPPYQFVCGGVSNSELGKRKDKSRKEICSLDTEITRKYTGGGGFGTKNRDYLGEVAETDNQNVTTKFVSKGITNEILEEWYRVMKKINIYIWCNKNMLRQILDFWVDKGAFIDVLVYCKTNPIPTCNNVYLSDIEYCVFAREKGVALGGTYETKHKWYLSSCNKKDKDLWQHPTIKPLEIIKNLVINSSKENDVVLDTFIGSGTTAVACKELNRNFIGFELNPNFCEMANDRLQGVSKKYKINKEKGILSLDDFM